ncbi:hypothetical protein PG984_016320 [Apiospora sp. TS-2023a]
MRMNTGARKEFAALYISAKDPPQVVWVQDAELQPVDVGKEHSKGTEIIKMRCRPTFARLFARKPDVTAAMGTKSGQ